MTVYLMKLPHVINPIIIDSNTWQSADLKGLHYNFFREFKEFEWIRKVGL